MNANHADRLSRWNEKYFAASPPSSKLERALQRECVLALRGDEAFPRLYEARLDALRKTR